MNTSFAVSPSGVRIAYDVNGYGVPIEEIDDDGYIYIPSGERNRAAMHSPLFCRGDPRTGRWLKLIVVKLRFEILISYARLPSRGKTWRSVYEKLEPGVGCTACKC